MIESLVCVLAVAVCGLVAGGVIFFDEMSTQLTNHEKAVAAQIQGLKSVNFLGAELYESEQQLRDEMKAAEAERRQKEQKEQAAPTAKGRPHGGRTSKSRGSGGKARTVDGEWR